MVTFVFATTGALVYAQSTPPFIRFESESGALQGSVCSIQDSTASGNAALRIGDNIPPANAVSINTNTTFQTIDGFGSTERVFDDPHVFDNFNSATGRSATTLTTAQQDAVLNYLYTDLGLTRVRPATEAGIEVINDNSDPNVANLSAFNFDWKRNDAHMDLIKRMRTRGVNTFFLSPVTYESWMTPSDVAETAELAMVVIRRWRDNGVELPYYSVLNEPSYPRSGIRSGEFLRDVIKIIGPKMRAEGINTKIVVPDDVRSSDGAPKAQVVLADATARQYVGALAIHLYDEDISNVSVMRDLSRTYNLPLWMTEWYQTNWQDWANTMHTLMADYDVSAVDYMWGFFGQWDNAQLVTLNHSGATYTGATRNKQYYVVGQYSKVVKQGFKRVQVSNVPSNVRISAYANGSELAIVAISNNGGDTPVTISMGGQCGTTSTLASFRTSVSENWANLPATTVQSGTFTTTLRANSVTTFTGN